MTLVIGVTGGIGSGKSALTSRLETHGIAVVDADLAARVVVEPGQPALAEIRERFGEHVIQPDGALNRPEMRKLVFAEPSARKDLEAITHPRIRDELQRQLSAANSDYVLLSSPLLIESGQISMVDLVVVVDVPESVQIERTMRRDDNDETLVKQIMAAQLSREERINAADLVIDNSDTEAALVEAADALHAELLERARQSLENR